MMYNYITGSIYR